MDFNLTNDQKDLRREIITFARKRLNEDVEGRDRAGTFSAELFAECGAAGLAGLMVEEEYGGVGLDAVSTMVALEAFGYGCEDGGLVFSVCAHLLACIVPIWKYGTEEQKRAVLPDLCAGKRIAVNAMTEPACGSDAFAMTTRAVADGDGFVINGVKTFASNGPVADLAVLYAVTDEDKRYHGGITAFLVDREKHGYQIGQKFQKMGLSTAPLSELVFDDVRVGPEAVLGHVGAGAQMFNESMEWERIGIPAAHVGAMERLLETAIKYTRTRKASGQALSKFQAVSHRIVDMKVRHETARLLIYKAASRLGVARDCGMDASMAKLYVSESLVTNALDTIRVMGGYGYMSEYEVERALRDGVASLIYSGTSEIQKNIVAGWRGR